MLRKINYTLCADSLLPHSPQFAGIQGENAATVLEFTLDTDFENAIDLLRKKYDMIAVRFDCIDGSGRQIIGETTEFDGGIISIVLTSVMTEMGGRIKGCLIFSGANNDREDEIQLYSFLLELYFKDFPIRADFSERKDLNQAVLQSKQLRAETYDIAASALATKDEIEEMYKVIVSVNGVSEQALQEIRLSAQEASANRDEAASFAGSALTYSVQSSSRANEAAQSAVTAADCADLAVTSSAEAQAYLNDIQLLVGDIASVLDNVVTVV